MRRSRNFSVITRDSLAYTLRCLGLKHDPAAFEASSTNIASRPLSGRDRRAAGREPQTGFLSRQHRHLNAAVRNSGLDRVLDATINIRLQKIFKPSPDVYALNRSDA